MLALALSLAASAWVARQESLEQEIAAPVAREGKPTANPVASVGRQRPEQEKADGEIRLDLERLAARKLDGTDIDPFRAKSWFVPPPPPPPEPPPKPSAPPLPFQYVGKAEEVGGKPAFYFANGSEFYTVSVGDKFATNYQLERAEPGTLSIRYLPLSILQTLSIGYSE